MTQPTLVVELTASGAADVDGYEAGQRIVLGVKLAEYFRAHGWCRILDPVDVDPDGTL